MEDSYPEGARLLHLGSGDIHWDGWINVDQHEGPWNGKQKNVGKPDVIADITHLPDEEGTADAIAAIHVIEHFYVWEVQTILAEWKRVLKSGGKLILELPSMDKVFRYIANAIDRKLPMSETFSTLPLWGDPKYRDVAMCHKWGYLFTTLSMELVKAGFVNIKGTKPRYHFVERDMRVEAFKP
jgi:ubiquinone/menaquinone biosynthesis C-methylase UbiE